jgi:hypothetical protein
MRVAPPVQALSCAAGPWQSIQLILYATSAAVAAWWSAAQLHEPGIWPALVGMLTALGTAAWARRKLAAPPRWLAWDGGAWHLVTPGDGRRTGQTEPVLDLGTWMLVRFIPADAGRAAWRQAIWLPLSRRDTVAAWPALRVALHAQRPARAA